MRYLFVFYPILYTVLLIIGLLKYDKIRNSFYLRLFLIFIGYSLLTEIIGFITGPVLGINNAIIYNTWNLVNPFFFMLFFLSRIVSIFVRRVLIGLIISYAIYSIIEISLFTNFINSFLDKNYIVGSFLIMISTLIFFYELLKSDKILNLKESMFYWIGLGVLLFNVCFIPAHVISEYTSYGFAYRIITLVLNLIMAGCFITGFIVSKKEFNI